MQDVNIKEVKKELYKSTFQDGFWDILIGATLISLVFIGSFLGFLLSSLIIGLALGLVRRYIILPRKGMVDFDKIIKNEKSKIAAIIIFGILFAALVMLAIIWDIRKYALVDLISWISITFILILFAYFIKFTRLYFYSLLIGGVSIISTLLNFHYDPTDVLLSLSYLIIGLVIISIGLFVLILFVKQHHISKGDIE